MAVQVVMPRLGESVIEGTVSRWLKREGEPVREYEPLLEVTTDKVDTEIPSPAAGILLKVYVEAGRTVEHGTLLALIGAAGEAAPEPERASAAAPDGVERAGFVSPVVARMAAEHKLDLAQIAGTGRGGRVTKKDVEAYLAARGADQPPAAPPWELQPGSGDLFKPTTEYDAPAAPADPAGEWLPLTPMRRRIAEHMVRSVRVAPHVTTAFEVDLSAVVRHREAHRAAFEREGVNLTYTAYFAAAAVAALRKTPALNARWADSGVFVHRAVHLGVAVALDDGLVVPVIRDAHNLNLAGLARAVGDLAARARAGTLLPDDVQGGTFTLTNHGVGGSLFATPIIHQPQVGILGVGAVEKRVRVIGDAIAIRPCAYVSLTFDHRIADGATGDRFLSVLKTALESWPA